MRASAGSNISIATRGPGPVDFANAVGTARRAPWNITTPLLAGNEFQTYTLTSPGPLNLSRIRHILIRPTDAAGASFDIESVRLISRREHLASVPSGVGWQGLGEIYRETLVARAPETMKFDVTLPERPWLDLGVGTPDDSPATFRVAISTRNEQTERTLLEHTVTTPYRWETAPDRSRGVRRTAGDAVAVDRRRRPRHARLLGHTGRSPRVETAATAGRREA